MKKKEEKARFELRFYEGYKGSETPRSVIISSKEFIIEEIIWRKRIRDQKTDKMFEVFKCKMEGEIVKITIHESGKFEITYL